MRPFTLAVPFIAIGLSCSRAGDAEVTSHAAALSATPLTVVTLGFDDTLTSQLRMRAALAANGIAATFYLNSDRIGATGYMTAADVAGLAADGHEIASHSIGHTRLEALTFDDASDRICGDVEGLTDRGYLPASFAFPFGANDATSEAAAATCLDSARDVGGATPATGCSSCNETLPPQDMYMIRTPSSLTQCPSAAAMQAMVETVMATGGGWLNLIFHGIAETPAECGDYVVLRSDLETLLTWLADEERAGELKVRPQEDVIGLVNPSFERFGATGAADCWERVKNGTNSGSFGRVRPGHSGRSAERITLTSFTSGDRRLRVDRDRLECRSEARPGHVYRLATWYKLTGGASDGRFVLYYRTAASTSWIELGQSPAFGAASDWTRASWDAPAVPDDATDLAAGVILKQVGTLTVDDLIMADLGPPVAAPPPPPPPPPGPEVSNASFETVSATDPSLSDCWERVTYLGTTGSFARANFGHTGSHAEQIQITSRTDGNRKLIADRKRSGCTLPVAPGAMYRLSAWYQFAAASGSAPAVRLTAYTLSSTTGKWEFLGSGPSVPASSTWSQMSWTMPAIPAAATRLSVGVYLQSLGLLTVDDFALTQP